MKRVLAGGSAEQMVSESNWDAQQYLESVEYPLSKEDLVSEAESKGAPQDFI